MLTTSTELPAAEVAKASKSLWRVERAFRTLKSALDVRPIFHQRDDSVIGPITGGFLALRLEVDLPRRLDAKGLAGPWPDLMRDLARLQAAIVGSTAPATVCAPTASATPPPPARPPASRSRPRSPPLGPIPDLQRPPPTTPPPSPRVVTRILSTG